MIKNTKKTGFTLTELLVVVVVIGVLSAVILPKFNKVMETRKTTEAEEVMAAVRTEQEYRCSMDKSYVGSVSKLGQVLPAEETKHFKYSLASVGMSAQSKGKYEYELRMPSYADGRLCCEGDGCTQLNKDYPSCSELVRKPDYQAAVGCTAVLSAPVIGVGCDSSHEEGSVEQEIACDCGTFKYTRWTCDGSTWKTYQDDSQCKDTTSQQKECVRQDGEWNSDTCSCTIKCGLDDPANRQQKDYCVEVGYGAAQGDWNWDTCKCDCPPGYVWDSQAGCMPTCDISKQEIMDQKYNCDDGYDNFYTFYGEWDMEECTCHCPEDTRWNPSNGCEKFCSRTSAKWEDKAHACIDGDRSRGWKGGTWNEQKCQCDCPQGSTVNNEGFCVPDCDPEDLEISWKVQSCEQGSQETEIKGTWNWYTCSCDCPESGDHYDYFYSTKNDPYGACEKRCGQYYENDRKACEKTRNLNKNYGVAVPGYWSESNCRCYCLRDYNVYYYYEYGNNDNMRGKWSGCIRFNQCSQGDVNVRKAHCANSDGGNDYVAGRWDEDTCSCECPLGSHYISNTTIDWLRGRCSRKGQVSDHYWGDWWEGYDETEDFEIHYAEFDIINDNDGEDQGEQDWGMDW